MRLVRRLSLTKTGRVPDADPWNLKENGLRTAEWAWFEQKRETALADGGEESGEDC
jgi:cytochrome c oxidase subunit 1